MKLSLGEQLNIFQQESSVYLLIYAAYALVVSGISLFFETRGQTPGREFEKLFMVYFALWAAAIALVTVSWFITGWRSRLFGGEFTTFLVTASISFALLYILKRTLTQTMEAGVSTSLLTGVLPALVLMLPYILITLFVFALGSGWSK